MLEALLSYQIGWAFWGIVCARECAGGGQTVMRSVPDHNPDLNHTKPITISNQMPQQSHSNLSNLSDRWANYSASTPGGIHNFMKGRGC